MKEIVIEEGGVFKKFFEHHKAYEEKIKEKIYQTNELIANAPHKIKTVRFYKYLHKTIYEYKIPLDSHLDCRVAYIFLEDKIVFFYISTNILKATFTKEVGKLSGISKG